MRWQARDRLGRAPVAAGCEWPRRQEEGDYRPQRGQTVSHDHSRLTSSRMRERCDMTTAKKRRKRRYMKRGAKRPTNLLLQTNSSLPSLTAAPSSSPWSILRSTSTFTITPNVVPTPPRRKEPELFERTRSHGRRGLSRRSACCCSTSSTVATRRGSKTRCVIAGAESRAAERCRPSFSALRFSTSLPLDIFESPSFPKSMRPNEVETGRWAEMGG